MSFEIQLEEVDCLIDFAFTQEAVRQLVELTLIEIVGAWLDGSHLVIEGQPFVDALLLDPRLHLQRG